MKRTVLVAAAFLTAASMAFGQPEKGPQPA